MTTDTKLAFAHPEERAEASAGADPRDRISLRDHIVEADIGAFQKERGHKQRLRFNVVVEVRPTPQPLDDDVDRILSYDRITEAIAAELAAERLNLLETLAERVAGRILAEPRAERVLLRVEKLDRGPGALGVEIVRRKGEASLARSDASLRPTLAFLDPAAVDLGALIDRLIEEHRPLVLVLALPPMALPDAATSAARLRIGLLAIEQAAWAVASRDPRLTVVASRTEIDWAMKAGKPILWAPMKLVLDSAGAPESVGDGLAPALWLAEMLGAARLVLHAPVAVPAGCRVPIEHG
jgi:dihydroneopterin aldolase